VSLWDRYWTQARHRCQAGERRWFERPVGQSVAHQLDVAVGSTVGRRGGIAVVNNAKVSARARHGQGVSAGTLLLATLAASESPAYQKALRNRNAPNGGTA
jgi:hypothetical protein